MSLGLKLFIAAGLLAVALPAKAEQGLGTWGNGYLRGMTAEYGVTVPIGSTVHVTNRVTGASVNVRVEGHVFGHDLLIVLSPDAGQALGMPQGKPVPLQVDEAP